jgi:predicted alpha/beta hydrolase family esterase
VGGNSNENWFPWLKEELLKKNIKVDVLEMPNTDYPKIEEWVGYLMNTVKEIGEETYFIGHSIGCQAIMRYLEKLPESIKIAGCVFVAGWFDLKEEVYEDEEDRGIAKPWVETPINFEKVKKHTNSFIAINSNNDPYVSLDDTKIFKEKLNAKVIIVNNKGHICEEHGVTEFPEILEFLK